MDVDSLDSLEEIEISFNSDISNEIEISLLTPNPHQPRLNDEKNIEELAQSILENGQLQPIIINQDNVIVGGHRRYYAHKHINKKTIYFHRVFTTEKKLYSFAVIENEDREPLTTIELALSYKQALDFAIFKDNKSLGESLGKSASHVSKIRNMLKLPIEIQDDIKEFQRKVSVENLNILMQIKGEDAKEKMIDLYFELIKGEINRKDIQEEVNIRKKKKVKKALVVSTKKATLDFSIKHLDDTKREEFENELSDLINKYQEQI